MTVLSVNIFNKEFVQQRRKNFEKFISTTTTNAY
jgi:hypothetical protein